MLENKEIEHGHRLYVSDKNIVVCTCIFVVWSLFWEERVSLTKYSCNRMKKTLYCPCAIPKQQLIFAFLAAVNEAKALSADEIRQQICMLNLYLMITLSLSLTFKYFGFTTTGIVSLCYFHFSCSSHIYLIDVICHESCKRSIKVKYIFINIIRKWL